MKRQHPFLSSLGFLFTLILLMGLGLVIWRSGGMAFSPGRLSAVNLSGRALGGFLSHAEFEGHCSLCHRPLETKQDALCEACHTDVVVQVRSGNGTHAFIENVNQCAACHPDHRGPEFDPAQAAFSKFDHTRTRFDLVWHQVDYGSTPMSCPACHTVKGGFTASMEMCAVCHATHDKEFLLKHFQEFGKNCTGCHDGRDRMVEFDHAKTAFPLEGKHAAISCAACHGFGSAGGGSTAASVDQTVLSKPRIGSGQPGIQLTVEHFKTTPSACLGCHAEPPSHKGMFDPNCAVCHTAEAWIPAVWQEKPFDHTEVAGFSLVHHAQDYQGLPLTCRDCHQDGLEQFDSQACISCHSQGEERASFMRRHQEQFGAACLDCHDGGDRMNNFDHASVFVLDGAHAEINCKACHVNQVFKGTPKECWQCHAEPAIHAGFFGRQCQNCHATQAWSPAGLRIHVFPLDHGGRGEVSCKTCHAGAYTQYTCYGCHDHQPEPIRASHVRAGVAVQDLPNCAICHPNGLKDEEIIPQE